MQRVILIGHPQFEHPIQHDIEIRDPKQLLNVAFPESRILRVRSTQDLPQTSSRVASFERTQAKREELPVYRFNGVEISMTLGALAAPGLGS